MIAGTVIAIILALCLGIPLWNAAQVSDTLPLEALMVATSILVLGVAVVSSACAWKGVHRTQLKEVPRAQELLLSDRLIPVGIYWCFFFAIVSFSGTALLGYFQLSPLWMLPAWIIFFGITFDVLRATTTRLLQYTRYPFLLKQMGRAFDKALKRHHEDTAIEWVKAATEALEKATIKARLHFADCALATIETMVGTYVHDISRQIVQSQSQSNSAGLPSLLDRVNYLSVFVCKRLEWVYMTAVREHVDPVASDIIASFGKMSLFLLRQHPLLAHIPLSFIAKCPKEAQVQSHPFVDETEMIVRATCTLSEACKSFIRISTEKNESYNALIRATLLDLETLVKAGYEKQYEANPALLMQPFAEIGELLAAPEYKNCPDREMILTELRRLMAEFQVLELIPPAVEETAAPPQDSTSSFQQDISGQ